jgi:methylated-DNA-protein-cysteine methyltransferase-like protein
MPEQKNFNQKVYEVVKSIPQGKVATYGQVAAIIGSPRAAQAVGWALHQMDNLPSEQFKQYPWWRVINSKGLISTTCDEHTYEVQKQLLEKERIKVEWNDKQKMYQIDLKKYLWQF